MMLKQLESLLNKNIKPMSMMPMISMMPTMSMMATMLIMKKKSKGGGWPSASILFH